MDHVFREEGNREELQIKYDRKLEELASIREQNAREQASDLADLNFMRDQLQRYRNTREEEFENMQNREKEAAKGLIDSRTGKVISDKVITVIVKSICRALGSKFKTY